MNGMASYTAFAVINKVIHKIDRFEVYSNLQMFFGIFKSGQGAALYERFHNKYNRNLIQFYKSLTCEQRILLTDYLKTY